MIQETKNFKKRFHLVGIPEKIKITNLLGACLAKKQMPGGRKMSPEELHLLEELLEWCNNNCFFDTTPKWETPKQFS